MWRCLKNLQHQHIGNDLKAVPVGIHNYFGLLVNFSLVMVYYHIYTHKTFGITGYCTYAALGAAHFEHTNLYDFYL